MRTRAQRDRLTHRVHTHGDISPEHTLTVDRDINRSSPPAYSSTVVARGRNQNPLHSVLKKRRGRVGSSSRKARLISVV